MVELLYLLWGAHCIFFATCSHTVQQHRVSNSLSTIVAASCIVSAYQLLLLSSQFALLASFADVVLHLQAELDRFCNAMIAIRQEIQEVIDGKADK